MTRDYAELSARCAALQYLLDEITAIPPECAGELVDVDLSASHKRILGALLGQRGRPMTRGQLTACVNISRPEADWASPQTVDAHICNIRKRLGPDSAIKIITHWGVGYSATVEA